MINEIVPECQKLYNCLVASPVSSGLVPQNWASCWVIRIVQVAEPNVAFLVNVGAFCFCDENIAQSGRGLER